MLHQLARYANDHDLAIQYGFAHDKCKWIIDIDQNGNFLSLRKIDSEFSLCPKYPPHFMNDSKLGRTHFLLESFEKITRNHFVVLMEQAKEIEPRFNAVAAFLRNEAQKKKLQEHKDAQSAKEIDKVTFSVDGQYLIQLTNWHDWWQEHIRSERGNGPTSAEMLCLLDGIATVPEASHRKIYISRAGGIPTGSVLASFDKDAFCSYGLKKSANAAMSENAVLTYTTALNHMIQNAAMPLGNVLVLHGYDRPIPIDDDIINMLNEINTGEDEAVQANAERQLKVLVEAVRNGKRPEYLQNSYYVFMVSGASGRVMIRDYFEGDCRQLADSFFAWVDDLSLVSPGGKGDARMPKLSGMLPRLISFREGDGKVFQRISDELSSIIPVIWRSVWMGTPLPDTIAAKALNHLRSRLLKTKKTGNAIPDTIACMWLKIWLTRGGTTMTKGLNRDEPSQAYHMGRLLAVYATLQAAAIRGVNVGVGQRYFASASTTPALVLGRLAALSNHHLAKLGDEEAEWYKQQLQEVAENIHTSLPDVMSLKDQSLFALGYYHQMADLSR